MDIGIDLGTTFSVISIIGRVELQADYGQGRYLEECGATLIPSPFGEPTFPSVVIEDPQNRGQLLFGTAALEAADAENAPIMFSKRKMGTHEILRTGTQRFSAQEVATRFLAYLRQCVEQALGTTIERAVVTHPAYFDRVAVEQTREAAIGAGFDMDRMDQMLMEPVAAALAYTRTDKRDPLNVLTYDLGGGTFDVTVLQRRAGVIDMKAFDGDHLLGGFNFDRELVDWVRKQLETRGRKIAPDMSTDSGRAAVASLLRVAEQVKIAISQTDSDDRMVEFRARGAVKDIAGKDVPINERLSRRDFVTMIKPYLDRTLRCCLNVIKKAGIEANDIDEVLLVGGSSYGPWVKEALQPLFPNCFPRLFNPDLCVAIGAAIHASMVLPKRVSSINLSLQLDVPERSVSELISITGDVLGNIPPGMAHLEIILRRKGNEEISRVALDVRRKFFFQDVELWEAGGPNVFCIDVEDDKRKVIFTHEFVILHESDSSDTSAVTTVLPRPLFVETYDGLVRLAPEGVALPARIQSTFQRLNNNANIELKLYQGGEAIGEVRIEDIPPEGGKGALVDLQVEVTQRNQIRGKAIVRSSDGRVYAEREVTVRLQVAQIPDEASLVTELALKEA
jgi:actin-like ATPase involved in cell morphogenesis